MYLMRMKTSIMSQKTKIFRNLTALFLLVSILCLTACGNGVNVDEEVNKENLNISAENVCRGFFQSLYQEDSKLFEMCFYKDALDANGVDAWQEYRELVDDNAVFLGTKYIATRPCDENNNLNYDTVKSNIAFFNDVDESTIDDIVLVSVKIFFKVDNKNKSIEIYSIVYKAENAWYFFSMVDVTAKEVKTS